MMQRRTTYESHESAPFLPEQRVRLSIPVSAGPISLADTVLQGTLDLSAGLKDSVGNPIDAVMILRDGVSALVREVRVQDSAGKILEHVRRCDVLAALRTSYVADPLGQEQRRLTQLVDEPLAVVFTDNTPVFPLLQFSLPLKELSLGMAELEYWDRGIQIDLVLSNKIDPFTRLQTNQAYLCSDKTAAGDIPFVNLEGWPYIGPRNCSDGGFGMDLQVGDTISMIYTDGATPRMATPVILSIDLTSRDRPKVTFVAFVPCTGIATDIVLVPRCQGVTVPAAEIVAATATPVLVKMIPVPIASVDANMFYVGQHVEVFGTDKLEGSGEISSISTTIESITETGAPAGMILLELKVGVAVTKDDGPPLVPGTLENAIIFESSGIASVEWAISRLELQTAPAIGSMPQGLIKITSVESLNKNLPTGVTSGEEEIRPSAANLGEALALIAIPLNQAAPVGASDGRAGHLIGYNDYFADYQIMLDGTSAPLQPINVQRTVPPQHLRIVAHTVEQTGMGVCKNFAVEDLVFARPFSRAEQTMDISGRRLAVRYQRTQSTATVIALQSFLWFNKLI